MPAADIEISPEVPEALPVDQRATWLLAEGEGLEVREVAAALGIPEGTVRSRMFHARRHLLEALARAGYDRAREGPEGPLAPLRLVGSGTGR